MRDSVTRMVSVGCMRRVVGLLWGEEVVMWRKKQSWREWGTLHCVKES